MASVTYDGRSFMLDGRRIWLVSGSIHHSRIPVDEWSDRLHAAKLAGLNTIETTVFWNEVEPRAGQFDFSGQADVAKFVRLVGEHGMMCILRPGPFSASGWDLGGIPHWLAMADDVKLRSGGPVFLEACSRYVTALAGQLSGLQVTSNDEGKPGPIVMIEQERSWTCGDESIRASYLDELGRYFREAGFKVPVINSNDLWQSVEGQVDGWRGEAGLFGSVRQLSSVRPTQPRVVIDFPSPRPVQLGSPPPEAPDPLTLQRRLAEAYAAGGQVNITPFARGTTFGFWPGRGLGTATDTGLRDASQDSGGMIDEGGSPVALFGPMRRLMNFASTFGRVLAAAQDDPRPIVADPDDPNATSIIHTSGSQGEVAWVFAREESGKKRTLETVHLVLPDGSGLDVPIGEQRVVWCLMNVHLGGRATLTRSSLCVLAHAGEMLVCFGPTGAEGEVTINGTPLRVEVPKEGQAHAEVVEGITVVVVSEETADQTFLTSSGVYVGVHSVDHNGEPVSLPGTGKKFTHVAAGGSVTSRSPGRSGSAPKSSLEAWTCAPSDEHITGESPRFATIDGPADLAKLGAPRGYGWYRAVVKLGAAKRCKLAAPGAEDRLQVFVDGQSVGVLGLGAGAKPELSVSLKRGQRTITVLAENAGRLCGGSTLLTPRGVTRELCEVTTMKIGKPTIAEDAPLEPLSLERALMNVHTGDATSPYRLRWVIAHRRKSPLVVTLGPSPTAGLLVLNGEIEAFVDQGGSVSLWLDAEKLNRGNNTIDFAPLLDGADPSDAEAIVGALSDATSVVEVTSEITAKAEWGFAKWEPPASSAFESVTKASMAGENAAPAWWRAEFSAEPSSEHPLMLTLSGMTKGQIFLNGRHLRRYFVATADGTATGAEQSVPLPASWLVEQANELLIFDEHSGNPSKIKLGYETNLKRIVDAGGAGAGDGEDES
ncbi:MAG: hypothetical protein CMJ31_12580 [Phycisphaerae bacterium]|nr:hypothetical protein [Phycisphaerae bacterium]